jgi:hypothetical protein
MSVRKRTWKTAAGEERRASFGKAMLGIEGHCPWLHAGNAQPWAHLSAGRGPVRWHETAANSQPWQGGRGRAPTAHSASAYSL